MSVEKSDEQLAYELQRKYMNENSDDSEVMNDELYAKQLQMEELNNVQTNEGQDRNNSQHYLLTRVPQVFAVYTFAKFGFIAVILLLFAEGWNSDAYNFYADNPNDSNQTDRQTRCNNCLNLAQNDPLYLYEFTVCKEMFPTLNANSNNILVNKFWINDFTFGSPNNIKIATQLYVIPVLAVVCLFTCGSVLLTQPDMDQGANENVRGYLYLFRFMRRMQIFHFYLALYLMGFAMSIYYLYIDYTDSNCIKSLKKKESIDTFVTLFFVSFGILFIWRILHCISTPLQGRCTCFSRTPLDWLLCIGGIIVCVTYFFTFSIAKDYKDVTGSNAFLSIMIGLVFLTLFDSAILLVVVKKYLAPTEDERKLSFKVGYPLFFGKRFQPTDGSGV